MTDFSDILLITDLDGTFFGAGGLLPARAKAYIGKNYGKKLLRNTRRG